MIALSEISALLQVVMVDLVLAGDNALVVGMLLLWVCWKLWREIRQQRRAMAADPAHCALPRPAKTFRQAVGQIMLADISMSLDNVLAVAGVARQHTWVLVVGLVLSVAFMGFAASVIARLLHRLYWLSYVGLGIILFVACHMIFDGTADVWGITH